MHETETQRAPTVSSFTRVNAWLTCPRRFKYRYIDEADEERTSAALILGSAVHEAVELFMKGLKDGQPATEDEVLGAFDLAFTDAANLAEEMDVPVNWGKSGFHDQAEKGAEMLRVFLDKVDRDINVIAVEQAFEIELEPGRNVSGYIDLILQDKERILVVDIKTSSSSYGKDRLDYDLQPTTYVAAAEQMYDAEGKVDFEYWVLTKTKKPAFRIYPVVRDEQDRNELIEAFHEVEAASIFGVFPRMRGWMCFGCEFRDRCNSDRGCSHGT